MIDRLEELLKRTDHAAPLPGASDGLIGRVRREHEREVVRRRFIVGVGMVMMVFGVAGEWMSRQQPAPPLAKAPGVSVDLAGELASAKIDAAIHDRTVALLMAARKPAVVTQRIAPPPDMRLERDRAALVLVYEADRHAKDNRPADAIAAYRRAVELFPQTHWADVARQRLKNMQT